MVHPNSKYSAKALLESNIKDNAATDLIFYYSYHHANNAPAITTTSEAKTMPLYPVHNISFWMCPLNLMSLNLASSGEATFTVGNVVSPAPLPPPHTQIQ